MKYQLFVLLFHNKLIRNDIFKKVNQINKYLSAGDDSHKWENAKNRILIIIRHNYFKEFKEYFKRYTSTIEVTKYSFLYYETIRLCLRYSRLEMLQSLVDDFGLEFINQIKFAIILKEASYTGRMDIIEFVMNQYSFNLSGSNIKYAYSEDLLNALYISPANSTDLKVIQFIYDMIADKQIIEIVRIYETTAKVGKIFIAEWLLENNLRLELISDYQSVFQIALENGKIEFLDWFKQIQTDIDLTQITIDIDQLVSNHATLDSLNWAKQNLNQFLCTSDAMDRAITTNDLEIIKWLHYNQSDCPITETTLKYSLMECSMGTLEWFFNNREESQQILLMDNTIHVTLDKYKWFQQHYRNAEGGCTTSSMDFACLFGKLDIVKWLHENRTEGCTTNAMDNAAKNGHFDIIEWLHLNRTEGCSHEAIDNASANSNLELVRWFAQNKKSGCSEKALASAIFNNNIELFDYLMEHVLPTTQSTLLLPVIEKAKLKFQSSSSSSDDINQSQTKLFEYFTAVVKNDIYIQVCEDFESFTHDMAFKNGCLPFVKGIEDMNPNENYTSINDYHLFLSGLYNHKHLVEYYLSLNREIPLSDTFFILYDNLYIELGDIIINHSMSIGPKEIVIGVHDDDNLEEKYQFLENHQHLFINKFPYT